MRKLAIYALSLFLFLGCTKEDDKKGETFYFRGTVNGEKVEWLIPYKSSSAKPGRFDAVMTSGGMNNKYFNCYPGDTSQHTSYGTGVEEDERVGKLGLFVSYHSSDFGNDWEVLKEKFANGPIPYGVDRRTCSDAIENGIVISYTDANGNYWKTKPSSGSFKQISLEDKTGIGQYQKKWKARFTCRLYNESGNYLDMVDCEIFGPVFPI